jgi:hypothetical protein
MQEIIMAHTPPPSHNVFDRNKVDWAELENYGLKKDVFGQSKTFEAMLRGEKSPDLYPLTIADKNNIGDDGDGFLRGYERISLKRNPDGSVGLKIHFPMEYEELYVTPFSGCKFSDEDVINLMLTRNLGHIVNLRDDHTGKLTPGYVSLDMLTNEPMAMEASKLKIPESLNLDKEQKNTLRSGQPLWVESMQSPSGKTFSALLQVNTEKKGIEFMFENDPRLKSLFNKDIPYPKEINGIRLTSEQHCKLADGLTLSFSKLKDAHGNTFEGSLRANFRTGKIDVIPKTNEEDLKVNKIQRRQGLKR